MPQTKTYRHRVSGAIGEFSPRLAAHFPDLEEVADEPPCVDCDSPSDPLAPGPLPTAGAVDMTINQDQE